MGLVDSTIANLWRHEFKKNSIGYNEIVLIGNNLGTLRNPEFIPNVFQLINLANEMQLAELPISYGQHVDPKSLPEPQAIMQQREDTKEARRINLTEIRNLLK
jgi:hypothetical protein